MLKSNQRFGKANLHLVPDPSVKVKSKQICWMLLCDLSLAVPPFWQVSVNDPTVASCCERRIRRDPCDECHERSEPALWAPLLLLLTNLRVYWSLNCLFNQTQWQYFETQPHIWGRKGIWGFKQLGFTRLSHFQANWVFTALLVLHICNIWTYRHYCVFVYAGHPLPSLKVAIVPASKN